MVILSLSLLSVVLQLAMGQTGNGGTVSRFGWGFRPWFSPRVRPSFGTGTGTGSSIGSQGDGFFEERLTCTYGSEGAGQVQVTLKRTNVNSGTGVRTIVTADVKLASTVNRNVKVVFTERASKDRDSTDGCSTEGFGPILGSSTIPGRWGAPPTVHTGVVKTFDMVAGQEFSFVLTDLPGSTLQSFAGRGFAFVEDLVTTADGGQVFMEPVFGCCALGYNNVDAFNRFL